MRTFFISAALLVFALGCDPINKPTMNPGQDCMQCHCSTDSSCTAARLPWSAAGTIFGAYDEIDDGGVQGIHVILTDALQKKVELVTNEAGNFYTMEALTPPLTISLQDPTGTVPMLAHPDATQIYGQGILGKGIGCNGCHAPPDPNTGLAPVPLGGGASDGVPAGRMVTPAVANGQ